MLDAGRGVGGRGGGGVAISKSKHVKSYRQQFKYNTTDTHISYLPDHPPPPQLN